MKRSENINELALALSKAQGEMGNATKDSNNPFYKSKYADLSSYINACRAVLAKYELSFTQIPSRTEQGLELITILMHSSGQSIESYLPINVRADGKVNELQALGSVISYLRRYALSSMLGMAAEDDDGNSGSDFKASQSPQPPQAQPNPQPNAFISKEQCEELRGLISKCHSDFVTQVMGYLSSQGMPSIDKMRTSSYEPIKKRIMKYLEDEFKGQNGHDETEG